MIKDIKLLMKNNIKPMMEFVLLFKVLTVFFALPIFLWGFKNILAITGYQYITNDNILSFILNPLTLMLILVLLILITIYSTFEIGTNIILLDASKQNKKITLKSAVKVSIAKSLKIYNPKNWGILILVLFLIPFLNIGLSSGVISSIKIPEFILDTIVNNKILLLMLVILIVFFTTILLRWIYSLHYFFIEERSFKECCKKSKRLGEKQHIKDFIKILYPQILLLIIFVAFISMGIVMIFLINKLLQSLIMTDIVLILILGTLFIFYALNIPIGYACVSALFYKHIEEKNYELIHVKFSEKENIESVNIWKHSTILIIVLGVIGLVCLTYNGVNGNYNFNIENIKQMEVTAHRGASVKYPENTMAAFKGAKELGADWVELDVQQTKDGYIIVSHDSNFERVTGENLNVWETTLDDIQKLDAGLFKGEEFKGEKIPLLEDVIKWAKDNKIKLNIELKPTGNEKEFEKSVIKIINENDFKKDCVLTSLDYEVLKNIKKEDNTIQTVYVMFVAVGDITQLEYANDFSIEASSIDEEMVNYIHNKGKKVYAWTIDTDENINKMIDFNVDNIITNDVVLGKELIAENRNSDMLNQFIKFIKYFFN